MFESHLKLGGLANASSTQTHRNVRRHAVAALAVAGLLLAGCGGSSDADNTPDDSSGATTMPGLPEKIKAAGKITVASSIGHPPFEFFKEDNKTPDGFDIEFMKAVADRLGVEIEFEDVRFPNIPPGLSSGRYDAAVSAMRDTEERRGYADFVDYVKNSYQLLVTAENPDGIESSDDLCGLKVGGVSGQTSLDYVEKFSDACVKAGKKAIETKEYPGTSAVLLALKNGRISAYYDTTATAGYTVKTDATFATVGPSENEVIYGIAFPHGHMDLVKVVQKAVQALIDDGTYAKILDNWGFNDLAVKSATINKGIG